jgi:hypothetical protein
VGGVVLSRAVDDPALSDRILLACRATLSAAYAGPSAAAPARPDSPA